MDEPLLSPTSTMVRSAGLRLAINTLITHRIVGLHKINARLLFVLLFLVGMANGL